MAKSIPKRQCVGCREMREKKEMIRVIKTAEEQILIDESGKQNGRGAYICKSVECLGKALKSNGLERSLKTKIPAQVIESLQEEMKQIEAR